MKTKELINKAQNYCDFIDFKTKKDNIKDELKILTLEQENISKKLNKFTCQKEEESLVEKLIINNSKIGLILNEIELCKKEGLRLIKYAN